MDVQRTRKQEELLAFLMARPGEIVPTTTLLMEVWGENLTGRDTGKVKTHVCYLRRTLLPGQRIESVFKRGYRFITPEATAAS